MGEPCVRVEVAYALADRQALLTLKVPAGTTIRQAVLVSGLGGMFPSLDVQHAPVGIFGRRIDDADTCPVQEGRRIEVYRPLLVDPKETRKRRAAKAARDRTRQR